MVMGAFTGMYFDAFFSLQFPQRNSISNWISLVAASALAYFQSTKRIDLHPSYVISNNIMAQISGKSTTLQAKKHFLSYIT